MPAAGAGERDNRIGAGKSSGNGIAYRLGVGADCRPVSGSQNDNGYRPACHTLLVTKPLIACNQSVEAGLFSSIEKFAIGQFGPSHLVSGTDLVAGKDPA